MLWLTAIGCLAVGIAIGFVLSGRTNEDPSKVTELEQKLQDIQRSHTSYREEVSDHFNMTRRVGSADDGQL